MGNNAAKVRSFLSDPLSDIARKERRNLIAASTIGLYVSWTGLTTLGIELSLTEQRNFLILLALIILYFAIAFVTYGLADYFIYRERRREYDVGVEAEILSANPPELTNPDDPDEVVPQLPWVYQWSKRLAVARNAVEFGFPLLLCIVSLVALVIFADPKASAP